MLRRSRAAIVASAVAASLMFPASPALPSVLTPPEHAVENLVSNAPRSVDATLPSEPTDVRATRLPWGAVDLSWSWPLAEGGAVRVGFVVHRYVNGAETRFTTPELAWVDQDAPVGATYGVSFVTTIGEGPVTGPIAPVPGSDVLVGITSRRDGEPLHLSGLALPNGQQFVGLPEAAAGSFARGATLSPDGLTVLTARVHDGGRSLWLEPVDGSSAPVRLWSGAENVGDLRWSPDGTRIAIRTWPTDNCCPASVRLLDASTGAVLWSASSFERPDWLPDSRTLIASTSDGLVRVNAATGAMIAGGPIHPSGHSPSVSPDGRWIAYVDELFEGQTVHVIPVNGGTPRVSDLRTVYRPVWAPDSRSLFATGYGTWAGGRLFQAPVSASGPIGASTASEFARPTSVSQVFTMAGARVAIKPTPALMGPIASISVNSSAVPTASLSCSVDGGGFSPCSTTYRTPALATGSHTVRVRSTELGGRVTEAARSFAVDATRPVAKVSALPLALLGSSTTLRYSATDQGGGRVSSYDIRYRHASVTGRLGSYVRPSSWQRRTSKSLSVKLNKGYTYCFSVRARDSVGNVGSWTSETCTNVALDDRALTGTGWSRSFSTSFLYGTYTWTGTKARVLSLKARARQVGLVVSTCSTCGAVDVRLAGAYLGRLYLTSSTTKYKRVLWLPKGVTRSGTLTITSASSKRVRIDGVILRH